MPAELQFCKICGKPPLAARAGSVTSFFFEHNYCQCHKAIITSNKPDKDDTNKICQQCGKAASENRKAGSFTGFLFKELRCQCKSPNFKAKKQRSATVGMGTASRLAQKQQLARLSTPLLTGNNIHVASGSVIGNTFKIRSVIGQGGMGTVYEAEHVTLHNPFALKILAPELVDEQSWLRFQGEAKMLASLTHQSFVKVYDLGIHEKSLPFYSMDLLAGRNLEDVLGEDGPLSWQATIEIFMAVLDGMAYAHRNGIIHRDLKPANIFLCASESGDKNQEIRILDFGISKLLHADKQVQNLTAVGEIFGSAYYMSPEQCSGLQVDARSDIYALGCSIFETISGYVPFAGETALEAALMHEETPPSLISEIVDDHTMPPALDLVVDKCLAKAPRDRYQSAKELYLDLERIKQGKTVLAEVQAFRSERNLTDDESGEKTVPLLVPLAVLLGLLLVVGSAIFFWSIASVPSRQAETASQFTATAEPSTAAMFKREVGEVYIIQENKTPLADIPLAQSYLKSHPEKYAAKIIRNGKKFIRFSFPKTFSIGDILVQSTGDSRKYEATGTVDVPQDTRIRFATNAVSETLPALLSKFDSTDLNRLKISGKANNAEQIFPALAHFSTITDLELVDTTCPPETFKVLLKLKKLEALSLVNCHVDAQELAKLKTFGQLNSFDVEQRNGVLPYLRALNPDLLYRLRVRTTPLSKVEIDRIATFKNLSRLSISSAIKNADLATLTALTNLKILDISDCYDLDEKCLPSLKKFKKLAIIQFPFSISLMPQDQTSLRQALPALRKMTWR